MFPVRLACVKHAASVHPEPGSNSLIKCLMHSRQPTSLVISRHYCFLKFILLNDDSLKNFRESYVFHCLVIKVLNSLSLRQLVYFITSTEACQALFSSFFRSFFDVCASLSGDSFTLSHPHWIVNNFFRFFQNFSNCLFRRNNSS